MRNIEEECSPNIIRMIKWRGMGLTGHIAGMGEKSAYRIFVVESECKRPLEDLNIRKNDNVKTDLREIGWDCGLDSSGSGQGPVAGSCEHGNQLSGSIKFWEFLEWLTDCWLLKKDSAPWNHL
jgi:hypothetical protein